MIRKGGEIIERKGRIRKLPGSGFPRLPLAAFLCCCLMAASFGILFFPGGDAKTALASATTSSEASGAEAVTTTSSEERKEWTLCIYLCGSSLESRQGWGTRTLEELTGTPLPGNANVVVQTGGSFAWTKGSLTVQNNHRYVIAEGALTDLGEIRENASISSQEQGGDTDKGQKGAGAGACSMSDPESLSRFLSFCAEEYPSEHSAVILWGHGLGPVGGVCPDETADQDTLSLPELREAFEEGVRSRDGVPYDFIGFDTCLMANLETAASLAEEAEYLVAAEGLETREGWEYTSLMNAVAKGKEPRDIVEAVCRGYREKSQAGKKGAAITLSAIDLSGISQVCQAFEKAMSSEGGVPERPADARHWLESRMFVPKSFSDPASEENAENLIDLYGFAKECEGEGSKATGKNPSGSEGKSETEPDAEAEKNAWGALRRALEDVIVCRICGEETEDAYGLSLWYPRSHEKSELERYLSVTPLKCYARFLEELEK